MDTLRCSPHPRTAFVEILYGCNLRCTYCYVGDDLNHKHPLVPSVERIAQTLNTLRQGNVEEIVLLGGEPLLHPKIADICGIVSDLGFPHRGIVTNGTVMTLDKAIVLRDAGFWVDVSFRGPDAPTFDTLAGKAGAFEKALNAALLLSSVGVPVGIEIDCVPLNHHRIFETIQQLVQSGIEIKQVQLHRISPMGNAEHRTDDFSLTLPQWQLVFAQAARAQNELNVRVIFEDGFPLCLLPPNFWHLIAPCPCGFTLLTISPSGDIRYCPCHGEVVGNIFHDPLTDIWRRGNRGDRAGNTVCSSCDLLEVCRGGCSASGHEAVSHVADEFQDRFHPIKLDHVSKLELAVIIGQDVTRELRT